MEVDLWPDNTLYYEISSGFSQDHRALIKGTVEQLGSQLSPCIRFMENSSGNRVIVQHNGKGCSADRGYKNTVQGIYLSARLSEKAL